MTTALDPAAIATLERIADNAWPAARRERLGDWILNAYAGYSGRLNACWPLGKPTVGHTLEGAVEAIELWYVRMGLPPLFKIAGDDPPLTDLLQARGYRARTPTLVMTGPVIRNRLPAQVVVSEQASAHFEAVFLGTQGDPADATERMAAFRRIPSPRFFARIERAGHPVAIGAACAAGGQVGLFGMRTLPVIVGKVWRQTSCGRCSALAGLRARRAPICRSRPATIRPSVSIALSGSPRPIGISTGQGPDQPGAGPGRPPTGPGPHRRGLPRRPVPAMASWLR